MVPSSNQVVPVSPAACNDHETTQAVWNIEDPAKAWEAKLRGSDRFMYANTSELNPMVMMGIMFVNRVPPHSLLRDMILKMVMQNRRMRSIIVKKNGAHAREKWVECSKIVLDDHIEYMPIVSSMSVMDHVNSLVNKSVDPSKPLFKLYVIQGKNERESRVCLNEYRKTNV
jgi:hypothetical protein